MSNLLRQFLALVLLLACGCALARDSTKMLSARDLAPSLANHDRSSIDDAIKFM